MPKPTKAMHEGRQVDAEEMEFRLQSPNEIVLEVEDHTVLKIFLTPAKVIRLKNEYNSDGEPIYQVKWGTGVSASVPVDLLKSPGTTSKAN